MSMFSVKLDEALSSYAGMQSLKIAKREIWRKRKITRSIYTKLARHPIKAKAKAMFRTC